MTEQPTMNAEQASTIQRLTESGLSTQRFLKVGKPNCAIDDEKNAFESEWEKHLYGPESLDTYPRWGICGKDGLVLVDADKVNMAKILSEILPETFESLSPRRGLPHRFFKIVGGQVQNKTLMLPGEDDGSGEIRADNEYLVAPGTTIHYRDLKTSEPKIGMYTITKNIPIATVQYDVFMKAVEPYFGKNKSQKITQNEMVNGVPAGMRHAKGIRYACHLIGKVKLDAATALIEMQRWNQLNEPPMSEKDIKRMVRDACRYIASENKIPLAQVIGCGGVVIPLFTELDADEKNESTPSKEQESQADRLVKLCEAEKMELFHDEHGTAYARFNLPCDTCDIIDTSSNISALKNIIGEGEVDKKLQTPKVSQVSQFKTVTYPLNSKYIKAWLGWLLWEKEGKTPGSEGINSALNVLRGKALLEGKQHQLYNRIAPASDGFYIDMADEQWRAIKVTAQGWEIIDNPPILFRRYGNQKPLIIPLLLTEVEAAVTALKFLEYTNTDPDDPQTRTALLITVISYFVPLIAHPAIVAHGTQGTAKSYLFRIIRRLIDPAVLELLTLTRDPKELVQQLSHNWCCFFDNVSYLPSDTSDALCNAITGGGNSKRELYTDDDDVIYTFKRCVALNGINIAAQRGDLLDRSLLVGLVRIEQQQRKTEEELNSKFNVEAPALLGAFLTILSKAIRIYPSVNPKRYFRLADWTKWACAISEALGKTQEEFMNAYDKKVRLQNEEAINASPLATVLLDYCKTIIKQPQLNLTAPKMEVTATILLKKLTCHAESLQVETRSAKWPSAANALSRALNRVSDALAAVGCKVDMREGTPRRIVIDASEVKADPPAKQAVTSSKIEPPQTVNKCSVCNGVKALEFEITYTDGSKALACNGCGEELAAKLYEASQ